MSVNFDNRCITTERSIKVWDLVFVGMTVAFFAVSIIYTYACEKL